MIRKTACRDIFFLKKYFAVDQNVFVNACKIILAKQSYSPFIVKTYLEWLINPYLQREFDIIGAFNSGINILEDIYFYFLQNDSNNDNEGVFLARIAEKDKSLYKRLAAELLQQSEINRLYNVNTGYSAIYNLDDYIGFIDNTINEAVSLAEIPLGSVPKIMKQFIILPENRDDLQTKRRNWIKHFITENSRDDTKMCCIFEAVSECSLDLTRDCIGWFVGQNHNAEAFLRLQILPCFCEAADSFVPVYNRWIDYLRSLLPLFHGIEFVEHKNHVLHKIEAIQQMIYNEEISDFIEG